MNSMDGANPQSERDYFSIGIGNVFVSASKNTDEWIGTIKASPADFVVREVSTHGLVAGLELTENDLPKLSPPKKRKADKITNEPKVSPDDPIDELTSILGQTGHHAQDLVTRLKAMDDEANKELQGEKDLIESPVIIDSLVDKELRTQVHVFLAAAFPLLDSQTSEGNSIEVTIDRRFVGLKPYLEYPAEDISLLSRFYRKIGSKQSITLRLKEGLPRSDRRPVHRIIDEKTNRMLRTTTVEGAIEVSWARRNHDRQRTMCVLKKVGFEHTAALSKLAKKLHCGINDITVAGIKDMLAVTYQFCVVTAKRKPNAVRLDRMELLPLGPTSYQLNRGELRGNRFELVIRNLRSQGEKELREEDVVQRISNACQFVNFYGEQRVGEPGVPSIVGVRAPDIGRAMLQGDYPKAIDLMMMGRKAILGKLVQPEEFRRVWKDSGGDVAATSAVQGLPAKERTILNGLKRFNDPLAAIKCLPFHDRMLYINAYQSLVWNHAATERLRVYGCEVVVGDLVMEDNLNTRKVKVVQEGEASSFQLVQVVLPLPGWDVVYPENEVSSLYERMLAEDSVVFSKEDEAESSAKGAYRHLISETQHPVHCHKIEDSDSDYHVAFELLAGSYATAFLREILRTTTAPVLLPATNTS